MPDVFDPYYKWLGIAPQEQPPNHFRLLGIRPFEADPEVIASAADRQMTHLRSFQLGPHSQAAQKLLNEVASARRCLLDPARKAAYERRLRMASQGEVPLAPARKPRSPGERAVTPPPAPQESTAGGQLSFLQDTAPPAATTSAARRMKSPWPATAIPAGIAIAAVLAAIVGYKVWFGGLNGQEVQSGSERSKLADAAKPSGESTSPVSKQPGAAPKDDISALLASVRKAIASRDLTQASSQLAATMRKSPAAAQFAQRERLNWMLPIQHQFWSGMNAFIHRIKPGTDLIVDGRSVGKLLAINGRSVTLEREGRVQMADIEKLPADFVAAVAQQFGIQSPSARLALAAFLAMDAGGDRARARELAATGISDARDVSNLLAELDVPLPSDITPVNGLVDVSAELAAKSKKPVKVAAVPRNPAAQAPVASAPNPAASAARQAPTDRQAVPDQAAHEAALKLVRETFQSDLDKATTTALKSELAEKLLALAESTTNPAEQFALIGQAIERAIDAPRPSLVARAIDQKSRQFNIDLFDELAAAAEKLAAARLAPADKQELAALASSRVEQAVAAANYRAALRLATVGVAMATKNSAPARKLAARHKELEALLAATDKLAESPDDAPANLVVGRFLCFTAQNWEQGLPHLAKGDDPVLAEIAKQEMANPQAAPDQAKQGDRWWDLAEKEKGPVQSQYQLRARHWYQLAVGQLSDLAKTKVKNRLDATSDVAASTASDDSAGASAADIRLPSGTVVSAKLMATPKDPIASLFPDLRKVYVARYNQAQIAGLFTYKSAKIDGAAVTFDRQEHPVAMLQYAAGKRNGVLRIWTPNGDRHLLAKYKSDKKDGVVCLFKKNDPWLFQEWNRDNLTDEFLVASAKPLKLARVKELDPAGQADYQAATQDLAKILEQVASSETTVEAEFSQWFAKSLSEKNAAKRQAIIDRGKANDAANNKSIQGLLKTGLGRAGF